MSNNVLDDDVFLPSQETVVSNNKNDFCVLSKPIENCCNLTGNDDLIFVKFIPSTTKKNGCKKAQFYVH